MNENFLLIEDIFDHHFPFEDNPVSTLKKYTHWLPFSHNIKIKDDHGHCTLQLVNHKYYVQVIV